MSELILFALNGILIYLVSDWLPGLVEKGGALSSGTDSLSFW